VGCSAEEDIVVNWILVSDEPRGITVTCQAIRVADACLVAQKQHPGVQWTHVIRRECYCHDRIDCGSAYDVCTACGRPAQNLDMGLQPMPDGAPGRLVCGLCYRFSIGLPFGEQRARVAEICGPSIAAGNTNIPDSKVTSKGWKP